MIISILFSVPGLCLAEWTHYPPTAGLSNGFVASITEDRQGAIWIGTIGGVNRFDGAHWTTYDDFGGATAGVVREDTDGNIWVGHRFGTLGGLSTFDGLRWHYVAAAMIGGENIYGIEEDQQGNIWVSTESSIARGNQSGWSIYTNVGGTPVNRPWALCVTSTNEVLVSLNDGSIGKYDPDSDSWDTYLKVPNASFSSRFLFEDASGSLWVKAGFGEVARFNGSQWTSYGPSDQGFPDGGAQCITQAPDGLIWLGTANGIGIFNGNYWRTETDVSIGDVSAIHLSSDGSLWVGNGRGGGVSRSDMTGSSTLPFGPPFVEFGAPYSPVLEAGGDIWVGSQTGPHRFDGSSWQDYTLPWSVHFTSQSEAVWVTGPSQGLSRFDGEGWNSQETPCTDPLTIYEDSRGHLWVACSSGGLHSVFDATPSNHPEVPDSVWIVTIWEDSQTNVWFGSEGDGVFRYDPQVDDWEIFPPRLGTAGGRVTAFEEEPSGHVWVGERNGLGVLQSGKWVHHPALDRVWVLDILHSQTGHTWCATSDGVWMWDGQTWTTYSVDQGVANSIAGSLAEDTAGWIWVGHPLADGSSGASVSAFNGESWKTYGRQDGIGAVEVVDILLDGWGELWFAGEDATTRYRPDHLPPSTKILSAPPALTTSETLVATFQAAFDRSGDVEFSHSLDGAPWSGWSPLRSVTVSGLADGNHELAVRSRDRAGNIESSPAVISFEIDATPPSPRITSPRPSAVISGTTQIDGKAIDHRFREYRIEAASVACPECGPITVTFDDQPVSEGRLGEWDTKTVPDGEYLLSLAVVDTIGASGVHEVNVLVDNHAPFAPETSPVRILASNGGYVRSANGQATVYMPPGALPQDVDVHLEEATVDHPDGDSTYASYRIEWDGLELSKLSILSIESSADLSATNSNLAVYLVEGEQWTRLGGTKVDDTWTIGVPTEGTYALRRDTAYPEFSGHSSLFNLDVVPRLLRLDGSDDNRFAITFELETAGAVSARVFNRAGRPVAHVSPWSAFRSGSNVIVWNARDSNHEQVPDGLYTIVLKTGGETHSKTVAVLR